MSDCPSCNGLNTSCPDGCGRDPLTGELNGTRYTRTAANVEAEPVAWLYENQSGYREAVVTRVIDGAWRGNGWTEEALVRATALEQVRKDALAAALQAVENERLADPQKGTSDEAYQQAIEHCLSAIRNLKDRAKPENPDA